MAARKDILLLFLETGGKQAMSSQNCYQVTVRDGRRKVVIDWTASLFSRVSVKTEEGKTIIAKKTFFGLLVAETYILNVHESVKTRDWLSVQLQRLRSNR